MASIFRTYPSVKQKHIKCVPNKMTEEDFWKKFFSSHYLHRDKNITDAKDLFTDCGKQDEQGISLLSEIVKLFLVLLIKFSSF